ncbi:serine/threonine protein kinase [Copromyces sp. CBS 386.78]|nr:serine/threonine protein kinase [Copromyces sp. CBS 386.78]
MLAFEVANNPSLSKKNDDKPSTASSGGFSDAPRIYELNPYPKGAVENPNEYRPGGYHPVLIGDRIGPNGWFRVVHKLGFGAFGTVWLCQDTRIRRWRAVKILSARTSTEDCADLKMLELFEGVDRDTLKKNGIVIPAEHFWIDGPNGRHLALVMELLGPDTTNLFKAYGHCDELMKDVCFQLLEAMQFIHSQGICHGDFRPQNILFRLKDWVDSCQEKELMELLGEPVRAPVVMYDDDDNMLPAKGEPGMPEYLVGCVDFSYGSGFVSTDVAVVDFGVAYSSSGHPAQSTSGVAGPYASPEDLCRIQELIGIKSDIWSCAAAMFEIRMGFPPFGTNNNAPSAIPSMERSMGPVPPPFRGVCLEWERNSIEDKEELQEKEKSETSWITTTAKRNAEARKNYLRMRGAEDFLKFRMLMDRSMDLTPEQAANVVIQAERFQGQLPMWTPVPEPERHYLFRRTFLKYQVPREEIDVFWDMVMTVFKWKPEERATIEEVMQHPWFGDRKERRAGIHDSRSRSTSSCSSTAPPAPTNRVNNDNFITRLGQVKFSITNWFTVHFWDETNDRTRGPAFLWRYLWRPCSKLWSKIEGFSASFFWFLMIIPEAWIIKRRIDRGVDGEGNGGFFFPSSMRGVY